MRQLVSLAFLLISITCVAQNPFYDSLNHKFDDTYLFDKFHEYRKDEGLIKGMLNEISSLDNDTLQQYAVIAFYNKGYGYKWISKDELTKMLDSLITNAQTSRINELAINVKKIREQGLVGQTIKPIKLKDANGQLIDLYAIDADYVVIDLWATWCSPCVNDMKHVYELKEKYNNIEFYSISFDNDFKKMEKFVEKKEYNWPIVFAGENHELWDYFDIRAVPHYYILNRDHQVVSSTVLNLEKQLATLK